MRPLIKVGDQWLWLWIAVEPEGRKILAMAVSRLRNGLVARSMLKDLRRRYGRDKGDYRRRSVVSLGRKEPGPGARGHERRDQELRGKADRDHQWTGPEPSTATIRAGAAIQRCVELPPPLRDLPPLRPDASRPRRAPMTQCKEKPSSSDYATSLR